MDARQLYAQLSCEGAAAVDAMEFVDPIRVAVDGGKVGVKLLHDLLIAATLQDQLLHAGAPDRGPLVLRQRLLVSGAQLAGQLVAGAHAFVATDLADVIEHGADADQHVPRDPADGPAVEQPDEHLLPPRGRSVELRTIGAL